MDAILTDETLYSLCEQIVVELMSKYGWQLLGQEELTHIVFMRAQAEDLRTELRVNKVVKNEYSKLLHQACTPRHHKINQAYQELGHYLYSIACRQVDHNKDAEDAVQKALLDIYQALSKNQCRIPGAFLAFSIGKLRGALTWVKRGKELGGEKTISWDSSVATAREVEMKPQSFDDPDAITEENLLAKAMWAELQHKFQAHPRATTQFIAVILKHAFGYSYREISNYLNVQSQEAVYNLLSRGRKKLASNQRFQSLALQILPLRFED